MKSDLLYLRLTISSLKYIKNIPRKNGPVTTNTTKFQKDDVNILLIYDYDKVSKPVVFRIG